MSFIKQAWHGEQPLGLVFWRSYVPFLLVSNLVFVALGMLGPQEPVYRFLAWPWWLLCLAYGIWIYVAIWRCARTAMPLYGMLARTLVVLAGLVAVIFLIAALLGL